MLKFSAQSEQLSPLGLKGLDSDFENLHISQKTSRDYILVSTFKWKTAFSAIYKPKSAWNHLFHIFRAAWKAYLTSMTLSTLSTTTLGRALSLPVIGAPSSSGATRTVSSSF
jgi:hypothetical protein